MGLLWLDLRMMAVGRAKQSDGGTKWSDLGALWDLGGGTWSLILKGQKVPSLATRYRQTPALGMVPMSCAKPARLLSYFLGISGAKQIALLQRPHSCYIFPEVSQQILKSCKDKMSQNHSLNRLPRPD